MRQGIKQTTAFGLGFRYEYFWKDPSGLHADQGELLVLARIHHISKLPSIV